MSDINDRLAALDPAARSPYEPRSLDEMISRIVASSPSGAARATWWQRVQVRIAGILILGTLIGATSLVIVDGGASLPVLAIQNVTQHPNAFASASAAPMKLSEPIEFTPTASLGSGVPTSPSYELRFPESAASEATLLAKAFGVSGALEHTPENWTTTSASGAALDYQTSGVPQWYYSSTTPAVAPATASSSTTTVMPSHKTLDADARKYLGRLGYHYGTFPPSYSTSTTSTTAVNGGPIQQSQEEVTYVVKVGGLATDQTMIFTVDAHNTLVYAQGPAFRVDRGIDYPLVSPLAGVSIMDATERAEFRTAAGTKATRPPSVRAAVSAASLSLGAFQVENGSTWLLPLYTYSGLVSQNGGTRTVGAWHALALEPAYLHLSPSEAQEVINY
ncbi:MAG: hypothetical protein ACRDVC_05480 [Acidimicrobiales bacterium]